MVRWHRSASRSKGVCCEVAELESRRVTRASLDRTGEKGEDAVGATAGVEFFQPLRRPAMINGSKMDLLSS